MCILRDLCMTYRLVHCAQFDKTVNNGPKTEFFTTPYMIAFSSIISEILILFLQIYKDFK